MSWRHKGDEIIQVARRIYGLRGSVLDTDPEVFRKVLSVGLEGTFNMCQAFARGVRQAQTPAAIVNLGSAAGIRACPCPATLLSFRSGGLPLTPTPSPQAGRGGQLVAPADHLALLVFCQFRFAAELDAARLRSRASSSNASAGSGA
jgi:NAD(P)-dependent dehydrogenase (short-subunit alcohol dehydrogenase family)